MSSEELQKWALTAEIIGGLAIVITLIFLVFETRQNTRATEAQTRDAMTERLNALQIAIGSNEFTALAFNKGLRGEELTPAEASAFNMLIQANLRMWENEWYQYQAGLFSEDEFEPRLIRWERSMGSCSYQRPWDNGIMFSPSFRNVINSLIEQAPPIECN